MKPMTAKKLDKYIAELYHKNGSGVQINMMDITKIYKVCQDAYKDAKDVEPVMIAAIAQYRLN